MKDLPTPEEYLMWPDMSGLYLREEVIAHLKEYATLVRDKTLQVAAENAVCEHADGDTWLSRNSILSLKEHKDLQI